MTSATRRSAWPVAGLMLIGKSAERQDSVQVLT